MAILIGFGVLVLLVYTNYSLGCYWDCRDRIERTAIKEQQRVVKLQQFAAARRRMRNV